MKRRDFFKKGAVSAVGASLVPMAGSANPVQLPESDRQKDQWKHLGENKIQKTSRKIEANYDVAVVGGGMAGICAAIAAARNGSKVVLIQDRPVLGGNSSSEMRVHLNGVNNLKDAKTGKSAAERETGIIEEILLLNRFRNKQESYWVWDHVLYEFVTNEKNLELMLNTSCRDVVMKGDSIKSAICWQLTTETEYTISAKCFVDCSGDGLLAASAGAEYRTGREGKAEFNEKYAPDQPDGWQMGATLIMESEDMGEPMPYEAPPFAIKYEGEKSHPKRKFAGYHNGIWWVEVGSDGDIVGEQEEIRDKLMGYAHGVWDYIKNSGNVKGSENMALTWIGSLPAKRESRRFIGDFILSEKDLTQHRHFKDAVAYGGWSLDEHCWAGIENLQDPPSYFHYHFKKIYEIPFRSLYSKNISNLFFAGRNISQTHIALSSSRVMATGALMGQAAGTAANLCAQKNVFPREIYEKHINELQENLMRDDAFIPNRPANDPDDFAKNAKLIFASSTTSGDAKKLVNGISRDINGEINHWQSDGLPAQVQMEWDKPVDLSKIEIKCDTNVKRNIMMRKDSLVSDIYWNDVPKELMKSLDIEARINGKWIKLGAIEKNRTRLIKFAFDNIKATAVRINLKETDGVSNAKLFEVRAYKV